MQTQPHHIVEDSINHAVEYLLGLQRPDGHWCAEIEGDTILESEYILLLTFLGNADQSKIEKAAEYIRRKQLLDGSWSIFHRGPGEISASIKAYFSLKLAGDHPESPHMCRARNAILRMGGAERSNSYTRFYLASLGQIPWDSAPAVPPEVILFPKWFFFNLYEISSWSRTFVVPLSIIWSHKPVTEVTADKGISELFISSNSAWPHEELTPSKRFFLGLDKLIKTADRHNIRPWREKALSTAQEWMFARFDNSSGLGAIFPPMVYSLMALRCIGLPDDDPRVASAREELERLEIEEGDTLRLQPCTSPVWDTAIAMNALAESAPTAARSALSNATDWILSKEVRSKGDWSVKRPHLEPGGWYFEYANEFYPDIDDTAMVLLALRQTHPDDSSGAIRRALDWILGMQGSDGGWASFDVDNNREIFCSIPFADHNAMIDPSTADITARILEMLAAYGFDDSNRQVSRGIDFVLRNQETDGSWFGRWGVNYVYGTWQALKGLTAIGLDVDHPSIKRGAEWLVSARHSDGGWGETCHTYEHPEDRTIGRSTPSQTAWAIMGLIAAGYTESPSVHEGINFLLSTQKPDGTWDEDDWTGTGFPRVFYLKYHLYRHSFPLWALGMYAKATSNVEERRDAA